MYSPWRHVSCRDTDPAPAEYEDTDPTGDYEPDTPSDSDDQKEKEEKEDLSHLIPSRKGSQCRYKGVYYETKRGCYRVKHGSETIGRYKTEVEAAQAYYNHVNGF